MKHEVKLGEIAYATPGDRFQFSPPKLNVSYRFQVGPANGQLGIYVMIRGVESGYVAAINDPGEDYVDCKCDREIYQIVVMRCRTAFQFVVTRTPNPVLAWVRSLFGR